jgi:hypothetical protein
MAKIGLIWSPCSAPSPAHNNQLKISIQSFKQAAAATAAAAGSGEK